MQVPAATAVTETPPVLAYGGAVPRQFGWIVAPGANGTSTPAGPAASICALSSGVSQSGLGCGSVVSVPPVLSDAAAGASPVPQTSVSAATTKSSLRTSILLL